MEVEAGRMGGGLEGVVLVDWGDGMWRFGVMVCYFVAGR